VTTVSKIATSTTCIHRATKSTKQHTLVSFTSRGEHYRIFEPMPTAAAREPR